MPTSFGLIDNTGAIIRGSGDFSVTKTNSNFYLKFNRDVRTAVVVASHHRPYCDSYGGDISITIGKDTLARDVVCVYGVDSQFSFVLIDDGIQIVELQD